MDDTITGALGNGNADVTIGSRADTGGLEWNGTIDEVLIFNSSLSDAEIDKIFHRGRERIVMLYPFDVNISGTTHDYTGSNNDAPLMNTTHYVSNGYLGGAMEFTSENEDYIQIPDDASLSVMAGDFSVAFWVKRKSTGGVQGIYDHESAASPNVGHQMFFQTDNTLRMRVDIGAQSQLIDMDTAITDSNWHHVVYTVERDSITGGKTYLDGVKESTEFSVAGVDGDLSPEQDFYFGVAGTTLPANYLNATLDEFMIVTEVLDQANITALFNNQSNLYQPRGTQEFQNNNITSGDFVNITINSTLIFDSILNISLGNLSGSTYDFGSEFSFTNNLASNIPLGTADNFSIKAIFFAGNSSLNPFKTPIILNNILIDSWNTAVAATGLSFDITPANESIFEIGNNDIELNVTPLDNEAASITVSIYGVNETSTANFYKHGLLWEETVSNGTLIPYTWTAPVTIPDSDTLFLFHLDTLSRYDENATRAFDFSDNGNNGTITGAVPNTTGGKFAGGIDFDGLGDNILTGLTDSNIQTENISITAWIKGKHKSEALAKGSILFKCDTGGACDDGSDGSFNFYVTSGASGGKVGFDIEELGEVLSTKLVNDSEWHHVAVTSVGSTDNISVYVDGVVDASGITTPSGGASSFPASVGGASVSVTDTFNGTIDEIAYW
ncbi:MAG: LamG-like jellyroll fold domain-containing protein, partial [Candidatus Hodarchaeales archaeon]